MLIPQTSIKDCENDLKNENLTEEQIQKNEENERKKFSELVKEHFIKFGWPEEEKFQNGKVIRDIKNEKIFILIIILIFILIIVLDLK
ncbi:unnamed protein product [Meloidogyne enterolobii]|uniref:Uncharacterized protein n=1 Tax=Meloidogyne enterolobii TaxID=390850 RepID=A0ACB0YAV3_MELEN